MTNYHFYFVLLIYVKKFGDIITFFTLNGQYITISYLLCIVFNQNNIITTKKLS